MPIHIGGKDAYKQRVFNDVVVSFQWVNDEPAMILWPKVARTLSKSAYAICLSSAYKYARSDGYPNTEYLIATSAEIAHTIGLDVTKMTISNIADAILDCIPDLIAMPPTPSDWKAQRQEEEIGEMLIKVNGETIAHQELTVPGATL